MKTILYIFSFIIGVAFFFYPQTTVSLSTGSPGGKTGSPSDNTDCTQCHTVLSTTSALTSITSNIPSSGYVPGNTYTITANINALSALNGFEITCEENNTNLKTGTFFITNPNETQLVNNGAAVTHTVGGNNSHTWSFDWEAPIAGTGDVNFYGAFIEAGYPFGANFSDYFSSYVLEVNEFVPNCVDSLQVTDITIISSTSTITIGIYNGYNSFLSYPYVLYTLDANGDTVHTGTLNSFGTLNLDTSWYSYPLSNTNLPTPPFSVYFVYTGGFNFLTDTCVLTYNMFTTNIIEETGVQPKKLLKIVDVLGRETRIIKNKPLFYIYNNGVREKKIIVE